ncbi:MAG: transcription termination/antitermination protein NusG [Puniceicoccales bacterium]|jgi:transcriptional antiterminator NusG|nr:transcription termination/antitermination protein NusG [Puniceicoccales bacterium]
MCSDSASDESAQGEGSFYWYTLQVLSNCEAKAQKALRLRARSIGAEKWIREILFPVALFCEVRNGKKITRQRKLYPGYLFAEMDLYEGNGELRQVLWRLIAETEGVSGFVGSGRRPTPLKQSEVDEIRARAATQQQPVMSKKFYEVGTPVKITDGPFAGSSGEVESLDEEAGRLRVSVGLFGRKTPVDLEFWQVSREEV